MSVYAEAQAAIAARRAVIEAGTAGPWLVHEMNCVYVGNQSDGRKNGLWEIVYAGEPDLSSLKPEYAERERADAALIVAAVNALPKDTDLIEAVLGRHTEFRIYDECDHNHAEGDPNTVNVYEVGVSCEDAFMYSVCRYCCCEADVYQSEDCANAHIQPCWPCPDARAALTALGVEVQ